VEGPFSADSVAKLDEGRLARNNRIAPKELLNRYCALVALLKSMLLAQAPKIVLQQNLPGTDSCAATKAGIQRAKSAKSSCQPSLTQ
jgi:hypothetical protein